jgi:trehalose 6-phosphate phosphatase
VTSAATLDAALAPWLADPARSGVLLDVDGTLAPIVRHADDAHVPEPTRLPLIAVAKRYGLVACISGRRAATARRIVSLGTITYAGNHGAELLRGGTIEPEIEPEVEAWRERVRGFAAEFFESAELHRLRVRSEDKDVIQALHWRGAPDEESAHAAVREIEVIARERGLATHWGRKVLEVRPPVELHKGHAVDRLLATVDLEAALYAGDDRTDLDAFRALKAAVADGRLRHALCIGVRSDETPPELEADADLLVDGPLGVRAILTTLAAV